MAGEIHTRGPDLAAGYTSEVLTIDPFSPDGWYTTGDIGVIEANGSLCVVDRKSDMIIRGGENISPAEVEDCLLTHPDIVEAAVIGVPDSRLGERSTAVLRTYGRRSLPSLQAIRDHLALEGLGMQKWPETIVSVDEIPRTPLGKINKAQLRVLVDQTNNETCEDAPLVKEKPQ